MRLIDADALKEAMNINGGCGICFRYVDDADTVDAVPMKHGRWIDENCSECGTYVYRGDADNYCPHCGAKMDGERKEE